MNYRLAVDLRTHVVDTARRIGDILNNDGPKTLTQLREQLHEANDILNLAVGWPVHDDKIEIRHECNSLHLRWKLSDPYFRIPSSKS